MNTYLIDGSFRQIIFKFSSSKHELHCSISRTCLPNKLSGLSTTDSTCRATLPSEQPIRVNDMVGMDVMVPSFHYRPKTFLSTAIEVGVRNLRMLKRIHFCKYYTIHDKALSFLLWGDKLSVSVRNRPFSHSLHCRSTMAWSRGLNRHF